MRGISILGLRGKYDFGFLMGCVEGSDSELVTVETLKARESLNVDIENLYTLKKIIGSI